MKNYKETRAFSRLTEIFEQTPRLSVLLADDQRNAALVHQTGNSLLDLSKTHLTPRFLDAMQAMADELDLAGQIRALFRGEPVNNTEQRPALHTALRSKGPVLIDGTDFRPRIDETFERIRKFAEGLHRGQWKGATGKALRYIVNIGIGGSYLGPLTVTEALKDRQKFPVAFLSNVDDEHLADIFNRFPPHETLYLVVSKSFSTPETLMNAAYIRDRLTAQWGGEAVNRHFAAVTSRPDKAREFGIDPGRIFPMWDFVGGRYSLWSAAGMSVPLALGYETFEALLQGAARADEDFRRKPWRQNPPFLLAAVTFMYRNLAGLASEVYVPYRQRLKYLPFYLQQLIMESNGKSVRRDGRPADGPTSPVVWGETGTNAQHSFFQALHQGTDPVPVFFLSYVQSSGEAAPNRRFLLANMLAQAESLALGKSDPLPHKNFPGNRPSVTWLFDRMSPENLGYMLAVFEHKTYVESLFWDINAFDQFGVELGKVQARKFDERLRTGSGTTPAEAFILRHGN